MVTLWYQNNKNAIDIDEYSEHSIGGPTILLMMREVSAIPVG